jgi:hypothetical protein
MKEFSDEAVPEVESKIGVSAFLNPPSLKQPPREARSRDLAEPACTEARQREHGARSSEIAMTSGRVASVIVRLISRRIALVLARLISKRLNMHPSIRLAMNAVLIPDREKGASRKARSLLGLKPEDKPSPVLAVWTHPFQIQFVGAAPGRGQAILREFEIQAADASTAIVAATNLMWPPRTQGLRILDREGHEVFSRRRTVERAIPTSTKHVAAGGPSPEETS